MPAHIVVLYSETSGECSTEIMNEAANYEIRVQGHLDERWADWFDGMTITACRAGQTQIIGTALDQAGLHGLIARIRDLGLPLISVQRLPRSYRMNPVSIAAGLSTRAKLASLWTFFFINVIIADLHRLFKPGFLQSMLSGTVNGVEITETVLLQAAIMIEIPILMVVLPNLVRQDINRWTHIVVGMLGIAYVWLNLPPGIDEIFFASIESAAVLAIIWTAWTWRKETN
jgi:hypothetical protein